MIKCAVKATEEDAILYEDRTELACARIAEDQRLVKVLESVKQR